MGMRQRYGLEGHGDGSKLVRPQAVLRGKAFLRYMLAVDMPSLHEITSLLGLLRSCPQRPHVSNQGATAGRQAVAGVKCR